ncbi:zinc finger protein 367-like [Cimex lectularius]|uniref:C2H2-type domain-containing protein n=1 Tax=Cimex lectularius TaxID=79782 RepID=A0A8I6TJS8_CIMLE|nr:zinc finger protein 367-like [Cimex lectularius]
MSENVYQPPTSPRSSESRRGRPKAAAISNLIIEGATSQSGIRCEVCSRVFPRDKSLQAHRRVHTGERPYSCDFPGCMRKFKQSGQLKTHQRLHTGERPFLCSADGCTSRFTHANRHCAAHPQAPLVRSEEQAPVLDMEQAGRSREVLQWFNKYRAERETRSAEKKDTLQTPMSKPRIDVLTPRTEDRELADMTNFTSASGETIEWTSPRKSPLKTPRPCNADRSRPVKNLFFTQPSSTPPSPAVVSPRKRELPKKRWLRIACREAMAGGPTANTANLVRPTVLRHASSFLSPPRHESQPATWSLLTPPYSDEKRSYETEDEELAVPLPPVQHHLDIYRQT